MAFQRALKLDRQMSNSTMSTPRQMIPARDVVVMTIHGSVQRSFPSSFSSPSCIHQNRVMNAEHGFLRSACTIRGPLPSPPNIFDSWRIATTLMRFLRLFCILCTVVPAHSWGRDAHEIIATMASHYLSATATAKVSALLGGANMSSVANWADLVHHQAEYSWSEPIHFTNVQDTSKQCLTPAGYGSCTFDYDRDCVDFHGNKDFCNAGAVANFSSQLLESKGVVSNGWCAV